MVRKTVMVLCSLVLVELLSSGIAFARGGFPPAWRWRSPTVGAIAVGFGLGIGSGYYRYAYGYDYPSGYGEYAEYGPWALKNYYADCFIVRRRMWTPYGWRLRNVRACD